MYDVFAPGLAEAGDEPAQFALWWDRSREQLFLFTRLVAGSADSASVLDSLNRQLGVNTDGMVQAYAPFADAEPAARAVRQNRSRRSRWVPATPEAIARLARTTTDSDSPRVAVASTAQSSVCPPGTCTGAQAANAVSGPVVVAPLPVPAGGIQPNELLAAAGGLVFCVPCDTGGDPPPGSCVGVVCDDGDPCTADSCSQGSCVFTPVGGACCDGSIATALADMQVGLAAFVDAEGLTANLQIDEPVPSATGGGSGLFVYGDTGFGVIGTVRSGSSSVACGTAADSVEVTFEVTDNNIFGSGGASQSWTLVMNLWQEGTTLHLDGTMTHVVIFGATTTSTGGWTYSDATGPLPDPISDPGFQDDVADMFNLVVPGGNTAAAGGLFGTLLSLIGNVAQMGINYILDIGIRYTPPASCLGPIIAGGAGGVCESNISCSDQIGDLATKIDQIPNVSIGFKKCMKGRLGCGGSRHSRLRVSCGTVDNCGGCAGTPAGGCSLGGTCNWYCQGTAATTCICSNTIFHEASHSCGTLDLQNGARNDSYRIGNWFEDEFKAENNFNNQCQPR